MEDFDEEQYLRNRYRLSDNPDLKDDLEQRILVRSHHRNWSGDPDTMHDVLDAVKRAILIGGDINEAIKSVPESNDNYSGYSGHDREDFGHFGDDRWLGE